MAYRRYCDNEKADLKKNKEMIDIGNEIEKMKTQNVHLRDKLGGGGGSVDKPDVEQKHNNETKSNKTNEVKPNVRFFFIYLFFYERLPRVASSILMKCNSLFKKFLQLDTFSK